MCGRVGSKRSSGVAAQKYTSTPGPGFLLKGIQTWIPFKRNPGPNVGVYFWAAYLIFKPGCVEAQSSLGSRSQEVLGFLRRPPWRWSLSLRFAPAPPLRQPARPPARPPPLPARPPLSALPRSARPPARQPARPPPPARPRHFLNAARLFLKPDSGRK